MVELLIVQRNTATDGATATAALQAVFGVGRVTVDEGELRWQQRSLVDDGVSATQIDSSGARVRGRAAASPDLVVTAVRSGSLEIQLPGQHITLGRGQIGLIPIGEPAEFSWRELQLETFSFPLSSIGRLLGTGPEDLNLRVGRFVATSDPVTRLWWRTAQALTSEVLQHPDLYRSDIIRESAIDALLAVTIDAFDLADADETDTAAIDRALRRAESFMGDNLARPVSIPDVARGVGISVRGLQLAYRARNLGTPLLHLRQLRMHAAHHRLMTADPGTTVAAVAQQLTYTNLGRFSAHYRSAFGENPAETLRAARSAEPAKTG